MQIYNTQFHKKQEFTPIDEGKVRMYVCGPTVYDQIHIGNARTFLSFDMIRRYLMFKGYQVTFPEDLAVAETLLGVRMDRGEALV